MQQRNTRSERIFIRAGSNLIPLMKVVFTICCLLTTLSSCSQPDKNQNYNQIGDVEISADTASITNRWDYSDTAPKIILTGQTRPDELLAYAKTLQGVPYKYASVNPDEGFDCSGFITHVFSHFNIAVPRSSKDFTDVEREIPVKQAKEGDIILFTGTDSTIRMVGHMGIIASEKNEPLAFIHSTSGKADGVTITPLNPYYQGRFVKVIRIFKENDL